MANIIKMDYLTIIIYSILGLLPSIIWLLYYLKKDLHPEPKRMIIKVFLAGAFITIPLLLLQMGLFQVLGNFEPSLSYYPLLIDIIKWFFIIALTEELAKYLVVKTTVFHSGEIDEPLDIMIYMITSALGFAAMENLFYLFSPLYTTPASQPLVMAIEISFIRFIGATFLHALCSGIVGYFLVKASFKPAKRAQIIFLGILTAVFLHGLYDFSIITVGPPFNVVFPTAIIIFLSLSLLSAFEKVVTLKSVSEI